MNQLVIFPSPLDARCELRHDTAGWTLVGVPAVHASGRPGQAFTIPDATPQANGVALTISAAKKLPLLQRGVLVLGDVPYLRMDDFHLNDAKGALRPFELDGHFCRYTDDGTEMLINEATGFRLFSRFVNGEMAQADAFCQSCVDNRINMVRVAVMQDTTLYLSDPARHYRIHPDDHPNFYPLLDEFVSDYLPQWGLYPDLICCTQTQSLLPDPTRQVAHVRQVFDVMHDKFGFVAKVNEHGIYDNSVSTDVLTCPKPSGATFLLSTGSKESGDETALDPLGDLVEIHLNDSNEWWRKGHNAWEMANRYNRGGYVSETTRTDKDLNLRHFEDDGKTQIAMTLAAMIHTPEGKNADPFAFSLAHLEAHNNGVFVGGVNFRRGQYQRQECAALRCYSMTVGGVGAYPWEVRA